MNLPSLWRRSPCAAQRHALPPPAEILTPTSAAPAAPALTHFGPGFEGTDFRRALGHFATGVTVITALAADGRPVGMTANSFNSVSLDPPLALWSLAKRAGTFEAFMGCQH